MTPTAIHISNTTEQQRLNLLYEERIENLERELKTLSNKLKAIQGQLFNAGLY